MSQRYLIEGYRLDLDRGKQEWRVFYFDSKNEMEEFIRDNDVRNKFKKVEWNETTIPDTTKPPRFEVMLRLKDGSHIQDYFYTERDMNEFLELYKNDTLSPIENHVWDREKEIKKSNEEFLGKALVIGIIILTLYFIFK